MFVVDPDLAHSRHSGPRAVSLRAQPGADAGGVQIRGTAYEFNNSSVRLADAVIRVAEYPRLRTTAARDGTYALRVPDRAKVTPYITGPGTTRFTCRRSGPPARTSSASTSGRPRRACTARSLRCSVFRWVLAASFATARSCRRSAPERFARSASGTSPRTARTASPELRPLRRRRCRDRFTSTSRSCPTRRSGDPRSTAAWSGRA